MSRAVLRDTITNTASTDPRARGKKPQLLRIGILVVILLGFYLLASYTGFLEELTVENVRETVSEAGLWGVFVYLVAYTLGLMIQIPGLVFVAAAIMVFGKFWGALLGFVGTVIAISINFVFIRSVGGRALDLIPGKFMKRVLDRLETNPIKTTVALRLIFWLAPPVTGALALSSIRYRDFIIGSALGMVPIITVAAVFFDYLFT